MTDMLLVVDMQNGFINDRTNHIIPNVLQLISACKKKGIPIAFTRFINRKNSGYVKWINWYRFMAPPEINLVDELAQYSDNVFDKYGYTSFIPEFEEFLALKYTKRIYMCGVATDGCVLKSAVDSFERDIEPVVIEDACASHAGKEVSDAGLLLISRFIGKNQIRNTSEVIAEIQSINR